MLIAFCTLSSIALAQAPALRLGLRSNPETSSRVHDSSVQSATTGASRNLGLAGFPSLSPYPGWGPILTISESAQGGSDLNGDGDTSDAVIHLVDRVTGLPVNLGIASSGLQSAIPAWSSWAAPGPAASARFPVLVSESSQGATDLNGDGDALDLVLFLVDSRTGDLTNLGVSSTQPVRMTSRAMLFTVQESSQGQDLNGDGDTLDRVVHLLEFDAGNVINLRLAVVSKAAFTGDRDLWSFRVSEAAQGVDLDGDGLLASDVPHLYASDTATLVNLAGQGIEAYSIAGERMVVVRDEAVFGADLNGDGDLLDKVQELKNASLATVLRSGLASYPLDLDPFTQELDGGVLGLGRWFGTVNESQQSVDLNGDGDLDDAVGFWIDLDTGAATNLGKAFSTFLPSQVDVVGGQNPTTSLVGFVHELFEGAQDLNGDGDSSDRILTEWDPQTGTFQSYGVAVVMKLWGFSDSRFLFLVDEFEQSLDLNGDGDLDDAVWHLLEPQTDQLTDLGLAVDLTDFGLPSVRAAGPDFAVFFVGEQASGNVDLNGDGDTHDNVLHLHDAVAGTTTNLGLAVVSIGVQNGRRLAFGVSESAQGGNDLNGDGDSDDVVLHVLDVP